MDEPKQDPQEARGIAAVIYMQRIIGINETQESARAMWHGMEKSERESLISLYSIQVRCSGKGRLL